MDNSARELEPQDTNALFLSGSAHLAGNNFRSRLAAELIETGAGFQNRRMRNG